MNTIIIKNNFIDFFKKNKYIEVLPSSLILENDKSLLFTNSGMVQFKNIFLGLEEYKNNRVTTSQTCIRVGGKHNDLENIGKTPHHNTSFEMLGNFGFENVQKEEAINLALDFLTKNLELNKSKLFITVNKNDLETYDIWKKQINKNRIIIGDNDTNFWQMAENGPCGYCTEIFYKISENSEELLEIWNLVFITFNKKNNKLHDLKKIHIDTGMGLERIASIKQNTFDNFKTDIYLEIIKNIIDELEIKTTDSNQNIRIITDHIKTCILIMLEGLIPSNDGRGYILKKLLRRSILKLQELKTKKHIYNLIDIFIKKLNIINKKIETTNSIKTIIYNEENKLYQTIKKGQLFIKNLIKNKSTLSGKILFTLYDTYGLPIDLIENLTKNSNLKLEILDFKKELSSYKNINKHKSLQNTLKLSYEQLEPTTFYGYEKNEIQTIIIKIIINNEDCQKINEGEYGIIITKETTFYAEKGGQIGDSGTIENLGNIFEVNNTKEINNIIIHYGKVIKGYLEIKETAITKINIKKRQYIANNHSATHILNATLKNILGHHIKQAGSLINENYLRFDFIHFSQISNAEKKQIEEKINNIIKMRLDVTIDYKTINITDSNKKNRIIKIGENVSQELCAGTHVKNTIEIGLFKIIKEYGIGNNIRRIEAITGHKVIELIEENENIIDDLTIILKSKKQTFKNTVLRLLEKSTELERYNTTLLKENMQNKIKNTLPIITKNNTKLVIIKEHLENTINIQTLTYDLKNTILINIIEKNKNLLINIGTTYDSKVNARAIINYLASKINCNGGGNDRIANGIIYEIKETTEIIKQIQLYLENF